MSATPQGVVTVVVGPRPTGGVVVVVIGPPAAAPSLAAGFVFVASLPTGAVATGFLKTTVGGVDYYLGPWTVPAVPALAVGFADGDYLVVAGGDVIVTQS